jgi:2-polyprenyl-3-methyl-5-hydroxy-6-metoxy-1,4-benzoquinol methylase
MLSLLPDDCTSLLDVGGGNGAFLQAARKRLPLCRTVLVESSPLACSEAAGNVDRVLQGNFLEVRLDDERFSGIAFLDVLEHALEPLAMLMKAKQLLQPGGFVIASIPNVAHWSVIADLIEGRWDYAPAGIHCVTHLRFFTRHSIVDLFQEAGFALERCQAALLPPPPWFDVGALRPHLEVDDNSLGTVAWHVLARLG